MAEFQWWLLLVGLVAGGGLVAVVFLDGARREQDVEEAELPAEARWITARLGGGDARLDARLDARQVEAVLREHREYRQMPPPDRLDPIAPPVPEPAEPRPGAGPAAGTSSGTAAGTASRSARG